VRSDSGSSLRKRQTASSRNATRSNVGATNELEMDMVQGLQTENLTVSATGENLTVSAENTCGNV
jgi:hypothetical protein